MASPRVETPTGAPKQEARIEVDLGNMANIIGRIKEAPVCLDRTLQQESMSTDDLIKLAFHVETPRSSFCTALAFHSNAEPSVVSSSSSTASRESSTFSELDGSAGGGSISATSKLVSTPVRLERAQSEQINLKVMSIAKSRNGRQTQRWYTDPKNHRVCRMVTGCVPIVEGGKILFVSASRKSEWILPKGGWEQDEEMEESAIRETFEEAGVLGILGPRLSEIEYETRKAKKRRLEKEENDRRAKLSREGSLDRQMGSHEANGPSVVPLSSATEIRAPTFAAPLSDEAMSRMRGHAFHSDETVSISSEASHNLYSHVRMTLFPLYVSEVKREWPECGRFRKAVDIDEAIRLCAGRPEFQAALREVKDRNLHHLHDDKGAPMCASDR